MPAATVIFGVLYLGYKQTGQQERYILDVDNLAAGVEKLKQIAFGRTAFFADGTELDFARVSSSDSPRDGIPVVLDYPLGPHRSWQTADAAPTADKLDVLNDVKVVSQMRFNTTAGKFWQRYFRYLPDNWVRGQRLIASVIDYFKPLDPGTPLPDLTSAAAHGTICRGFWSYLIANTKYGHRVTKNTYEVGTFNLITHAQITSKKCGRRFRTPRGRLSVAGG